MDSKHVLVFLLGFFSCAFLFYGFSYSGVEVPFASGLTNFDVSAPNDWVSEDDIIVFDDRIVLMVSDATLSRYADSGSMKPVFDEGANGIRVVPGSANEIDVGDIVSYRFAGMLIVHRVVGKGFDDEGVYFVMKGDNNLASDGKVRFNQIEYVTVGVIY
jgi:hypothetical protein